MKNHISDGTRIRVLSRHSGAPALDAKDFLESEKGQATIQKAAKFADRLKLKSVGELPHLASEPA